MATLSPPRPPIHSDRHRTETAPQIEAWAAERPQARAPAMSLPARDKMGFWQVKKKKLLRALLGRYVPLHMFARPKHGFAVPLHAWFRGEMRWLLQEYLDPGRIKREGLFDAEFVRAVVDEHLSGRRDREALLWSLVFWQLWREKWKV